jgi:hypothetical protein
MAEPHAHDPHDPRGGRTNPTGPQGPEAQEKWQKSKYGEAAVREANVKAAGESPEPEAQDDE